MVIWYDAQGPIARAHVAQQEQAIVIMAGDHAPSYLASAIAKPLPAAPDTRGTEAEGV